jgi:hypothetical protein
MKSKQFLKIQLSYVLIYPILFIVYSLLFNSLKLTTGNVLLDVGILTGLTGVSGYLLAFYLHQGRIRLK